MILILSSDETTDIGTSKKGHHNVSIPSGMSQTRSMFTKNNFEAY